LACVASTPLAAQALISQYNHGGHGGHGGHGSQATTTIAAATPSAKMALFIGCALSG